MNRLSGEGNDLDLEGVIKSGEVVCVLVNKLWLGNAIAGADPAARGMGEFEYVLSHAKPTRRHPRHARQSRRSHCHYQARAC